MFEGFEEADASLDDVMIHYRKAGTGPPLLLIHGYPQNHVMWHKVAPTLAEHFTVVCPDLRGYGESGKPPGAPDHSNYSKRRMALDLVQLMSHLGFEQFRVAGHDRGGRVTHRMCLDHPDRVLRASVMDIIPTRTLFESTNMDLAMGYYHWYFLAQPYPLPETLIGGDPVAYLHMKGTVWTGSKTAEVFSPEATAHYEKCFSNPETIHGSCEDYRAAATIDLEHDRADADNRIACPLQVLWGERGLMHKLFDVPGTWVEKCAGPISSQIIPSGHFLPEECSEETLAAMMAFFKS